MFKNKKKIVSRILTEKKFNCFKNKQGKLQSLKCTEALNLVCRNNVRFDSTKSKKIVKTDYGFEENIQNTHVKQKKETNT